MQSGGGRPMSAPTDRSPARRTPGRSTRSAPRFRMHRRATAGPSGTSNSAAACSRSTSFASSIWRRSLRPLALRAAGGENSGMSWLLRSFLVGLVALVGSTAAFAQPPVPASQGAQVDDEQRLNRAIAALKPERPGVVDAYVVVAALDSDPVFEREARETARVLASRFDAQGRTLVLATDEGNDKGDAPATPDGLARALGRVASLMNRDEDVLVLYTTSHGSPHA